MKLTIIMADKAVYIDGYAILNLDLSNCGVPDSIRAVQWSGSDGWIEYKNSQIPNEVITELPDWANNCIAVWDVAHEYQVNPPPPPPPTLEENKEWASYLLSETDWTTIPDVADPTKSNPYLVNVDAFVTYRNIVRQYAINPTAGNLDWPEKPNAIWATT